MGLAYKGAKLYFGQASLEALAKKYGTPFYLYDLDAIAARVKEHRAAFTSVALHYAMKANHCRDVMTTIRQSGAGADVVSGGELKLALKYGFKPQDIIFSGVGKTEEELVFAIKKKIKLINVESPSELKRLARISKKLKTTAHIGLRFNPDVNAETHPYITTGFRENKFGMDESFFSEVRDILSKNGKHVELNAISLHIGSQLKQLEPLRAAIQKTIPVFEDLRKEYPLTMFDVGGGLAIDYHDGKPPLSTLKNYGQMVESLLNPVKCQILCEPGRILVGEAGVLVSRVEYIKSTKHKTFVIVDTGMHHLMRPSLYQAHHRVLPVFRRDGEMNCDVVGPICESSDFLARDRKITRIEEGDYLAIGETGAYGYTMSSDYNLQSEAKQLVLKGKAVKLST